MARPPLMVAVIATVAASASSFLSPSHPLTTRLLPMSWQQHHHRPPLPTTHPRAIFSMMSSTTSPEVSTLLRQAGEGRKPLDLRGVFGALTTPGSPFMSEYWQKRPFVSDPQEGRVESLVGAWTLDTMAEAIDSEFLIAGRGTFQEGKTGWQMANVGTAKGSSFEDAKLKVDDVRQAMSKKSGTVVFNSAGANIPAMAGVCLDATETFGFPTCVNLYLTAAGQKTSAPPHTDYQDVFVLQTQGRKHWRVYAPPPPGRKPKVSPFTRGKDKDILSLDELGPPLIDTVLEPGQILYMPSAFPHTTDTVTTTADSSDSAQEPSVHITLGVDTHIWGLTHAKMREYLLQKRGETKGVIADPPRTLEDVDAFMSFHESLPLGCSGEAFPEGMKWSQAKVAHADRIVKDFLKKVREVEPENELWQGDDTEVDQRLGLGELALRLVEHHHRINILFSEMYRDVKYKFGESVQDLSLFRSRPHLERIDRHMQLLIESVAPNLSSVQAVGGGGGEEGGGAGKKKGFAGGAKGKPASSKGFGKR